MGCIYLLFFFQILINTKQFIISYECHFGAHRFKNVFVFAQRMDERKTKRTKQKNVMKRKRDEKCFQIKIAISISWDACE